MTPIETDAKSMMFLSIKYILITELKRLQDKM